MLFYIHTRIETVSNIRHKITIKFSHVKELGYLICKTNLLI